MNIFKKLVWIVLLAGLSSNAVAAQSVTKLLDSGSSGDKLDLVIIGDGFQANEQAAYNTFVNDFVTDGLFNDGVLSETMNAYNIHRINIDSTDSGVTQIATQTAPLTPNVVSNGVRLIFAFTGGNAIANIPLLSRVTITDPAGTTITDRSGQLADSFDNAGNPNGITQGTINYTNGTVTLNYTLGNAPPAGAFQISYSNVSDTRNTAIDYRFSGNWNRCWMERGPNTTTKLNAILDALVSEYDLIFVILNDSSFGGCAGGSQLAVTVGSDWTVGAHEMGHMVGKLADEYCRAGAYTGTEPNTVNITTTSTRKGLKWLNFVNPSTPIPTGINANQGNGQCTAYNQGTGAAPAGWDNALDVGLFEGAQYTDNGLYRPVVNCRMRGNNPAFCPVCYLGMRDQIKPYHEHTFSKSYTGDFNNDKLSDVVIHNANSLALYLSNGSTLELAWIATGKIPIWDDFKPNDHFLVADFNNDGMDDLYVYNMKDWSMPYLAMLRSTGTGFEAIRRYDRKLPGWDDMRDHDKFYVADFDGDGREDLYLFNSEDWRVGYLEMLRSTGTSLSNAHRYDQKLPGWDDMKKNDKFYVADFNGDGRKDLYIFNGHDWSMGYLEMLRSNSTSMSNAHRFDGELPGWDDMKKNDRFFVGNFDGDEDDDLYIFNGHDWSMEYFQMLRSNGNNMSNARRFDDSIPGWGRLKPNDKFFVADVNGDSDDDIYVYNSSDWVTEYLGTLRSSGNNLSGGWQDDWIGSWNLGNNDHFLVGNFNGGSGWDDLFIRNDNWFGLLRSHSSSVQNTKIFPRYIRNEKYHSIGWW